MSTSLSLDFDDKVALSSQVLTKLLNDESVGNVVEAMLNDGGYDTESVRDELADGNDSSIIEYLEEHSTDWKERDRQIFLETLTDIFLHGITDYQTLTRHPNDSETETNQTEGSNHRKLTDLNEWQNANAVQLRYALRFVLLERNKNETKQINTDKVISFLCDKQKFEGKDLKMSKCKFAHLLFENVSVCHLPAKRILQSLRDYKFWRMPTNYSDLCIPQIFSEGIRTKLELNDCSKMSGEEILRSIQFKAFSDCIFERNRFVNLLKNECGIPIGESIKLHTFTKEFVSKNRAKFFQLTNAKSEFIHLMSKRILPRFNEKNSKNQLNANEIVRFIKSRSDINEKYFSHKNRKLVASEIKKFNKTIKTGPIRKLCSNFNSHLVFK